MPLYPPTRNALLDALSDVREYIANGDYDKAYDRAETILEDAERAAEKPADRDTYREWKDSVEMAAA